MRYHRLTGLLLALGLVFLSACQKGQLTPSEEEVTLRLTLQGGIVPFEADGGTRAAPVMDWAEGDRILSGHRVSPRLPSPRRRWALTARGISATKAV